MRRRPRLISKGRSFVRAVAIVAFGICSCQFSTNVPLYNNSPHFVSGHAINKALFYPDSVVCTLAVEDLNDEQLSITACYKDSGDTSCSPESWKGSCRWFEKGLGVKHAELTIEPSRLGCFSGHLHIADPEGAEIKTPFSIKMSLIDPFNRFPLNNRLWAPEPTQDSNFLSFDYSNKKLEFFFDSTGDSTRASTGIRSLFTISGDCSTKVHFQLRNDMRKGFEIAFFLSTNPVADPWHPVKTGFFIEGLGTHIQLSCISVDMQTYSSDFNGPPAGKLSISRTASTVEFSYIPVDPQWSVVNMNPMFFPADSAVYLHLRMKVDDRLRPRHCLWSDLEVTKGTIAFGGH